MTTTDSLLSHVIVPVASVADARATASAVVPRLERAGGRATVVNVIEKAGGAPDKASVEQRELEAEKMFDAIQDTFHEAGVPLESEILYGTDVVEAVEEAALERDATAIVFTPRGGNRWIQLLAGDVAKRLVEDSSLPVIALHEDGEDEQFGTDSSDENGGDVDG